MWPTRKNSWKLNLGFTALMTMLTAFMALLAVLEYFDEISVFDSDHGEFEQNKYSVVEVWPPGGVEEQIAHRVLDVANAAGCPSGSVRLIEATITVSPASAQSGNMPLAKALAVIELPPGTEPATLHVRENGQGVSPEFATSEARSRLLTKVVARLQTGLDC